METKHIQWENSPEGAWINAKDFDPSIHKPWVEPIPELPLTVEIAGLEDAIAPLPVLPHPIKKTSKKKVIADDLAIS